MKTSVETLEGNKVKLSVEVDQQEFEKAIDAAVRKIAREVRIPGFRPGKAPRRLLEARIGREGVRQEAMREALPEYYAQALRETEVDAISPPEIDVTSGEDGGPLAFDAVVEVRPTVSVAGYQGLKVAIPAVGVSEDEVDRQIDRLRRPFGELREVQRPAQDDDHVTVNIKGSKDGEDVDALSADDYVYEVGSGGVVPELDDQLRGAKVGDILRFDSEIGEDAVSFQVLVKDVKQMVLPEVTDEWAQEASEFDTVAELRDDLRTRMVTVKRAQAAMALRDAVVEAVGELVAEDVPDALVNSEMERRIHDLAHRLQGQGATIEQYLEATGQRQEDFVAELRAASTAAVKADLALRAVADAEDITVTAEDVAGELERLAPRFGTTAADLRDQLDRAEQLPAVRSDLKKSKALGWLLDHVEIVDEDGNPVDRSELSDPDENDAGAESGETGDKAAAEEPAQQDERGETEGDE